MANDNIPVSPEATQEREERIRKRAHYIWQSEGWPEGKEQEHWERAKQELANEERATTNDSDA